MKRGKAGADDARDDGEQRKQTLSIKTQRGQGPESAAGVEVRGERKKVRGVVYSYFGLRLTIHDSRVKQGGMAPSLRDFILGTTL